MAEKDEKKKQSPKKKSALSLVMIVVAVITVVIGGGGYFYVSSGVNQTINSDKVTLFTVNNGETLLKLCARLEKQQMVSGCLPLKIHSKISDTYTKIKSGTYEIEPEMPLSAFLLAVVEGRQKQYAFTIIEGENIYQVLDKIDKAKYLNNDLKGKSIKKVAEALDLPYESPEGWLYPETYNYALNSTASDLLKRAIAKQKSLLTSLWPDRRGNLTIYKPYQALILASIIEKESSADAERSVISSVFHNRLRDGMRLQTDPTVIYGIWHEYEGDITRQHLKQKTRYNTYRIDGLPPTPIANASKASLEAALNPASTDYYYFVASGDGEHVFNQTLEQHNRAVRNYLRKQRLESLKKNNG
ncbi:MAG: endolytic transglycosylase MltG [Gammaproteobacteria bacterium]|nr:endolytic transglycosylase MltG [Gammaproteobacteria bacterium]